MKCLFCTFGGSHAELIAHSAACEWHPLWKKLVAETKRLDWVIERGAWFRQLGDFWSVSRPHLSRRSGDGDSPRAAIDDAIQRMAMPAEMGREDAAS